MALLKKVLTLFLTISLTTISAAELEREFSPSSSEEIQALSSQSDYLIGGIISPLSGLPVLSKEDLIAKGAETISLTRTYVSPSFPKLYDTPAIENFLLNEYLLFNYRGWTYFPQTKLQVSFANKSNPLVCPN